MTTLTVTRVNALPRVNLLPEEIAKAAQFRRVQALLGLVLAAVLGGLGLAFVVASGQVGSAQESLDAASATNASLKVEVTKYAQVPKTQAALAKGQQDLATAMSPEVRWSFYLNDLSLTIPSTVRLTTMTVVEPVPTDASSGEPLTSPLGTPGIAVITFEGKATSYDAVAAWLQTLMHQKGYTDPTVTEVTQDDTDNLSGDVFLFKSSVTVTADALSGRYTTTTGE